MSAQSVPVGAWRATRPRGVGAREGDQRTIADFDGDLLNFQIRLTQQRARDLEPALLGAMLGPRSRGAGHPVRGRRRRADRRGPPADPRRTRPGRHLAQADRGGADRRERPRRASLGGAGRGPIRQAGRPVADDPAHGLCPGELAGCAARALAVPDVAALGRGSSPSCLSMRRATSTGRRRSSPRRGRQCFRPGRQAEGRRRLEERCRPGARHARALPGPARSATGRVIRVESAPATAGR